MKNGRNILLLLCVLSFMFLLGLFVGRNSETKYVALRENDTVSVNTIAEGDSDYRLDINTATKIQFMELPGIGEVIAERILQYRDENGSFTAIDDLLNVEGIGESKFQQIEKFIRVGG